MPIAYCLSLRPNNVKAFEPWWTVRTERVSLDCREDISNRVAQFLRFILVPVRATLTQKIRSFAEAVVALCSAISSLLMLLTEFVVELQEVSAITGMTANKNNFIVKASIAQICEAEFNSTSLEDFGRKLNNYIDFQATLCSIIDPAQHS
ncbi:MAG: hypothetical protein CMQ17_04820 [Gammaproteobacteria bacterium]|nr:hypothetical protein [Gammaproteobacteria bacterium]